MRQLDFNRLKVKDVNAVEVGHEHDRKSVRTSAVRLQCRAAFLMNMSVYQTVHVSAGQSLNGAHTGQLWRYAQAIVNNILKMLSGRDWLRL
jgi:hypothetical protein